MSGFLTSDQADGEFASHSGVAKGNWIIAMHAQDIPDAADFFSFNSYETFKQALLNVVPFMDSYLDELSAESSQWLEETQSKIQSLLPNHEDLHWDFHELKDYLNDDVLSHYNVDWIGSFDELLGGNDEFSAFLRTQFQDNYEVISDLNIANFLKYLNEDGGRIISQYSERDL